MFAGSRFCAHCGAEVRRDVIADQEVRKCPRCRDDMSALRLGDTSVQECGSCGGLWLDPASLQALSDARESRSAIVGALAARAPQSRTAAPDVIRYLPCPVCGKLLNRVNFAHSSGVVLDVCKTDGVWLDRGELQRVLGFVDAGGLSVARQREREQLVEEQRRIAVMQRGGSDGVLSLDARAFSSDAHDGTRGGSIGRLLFDALGAVLR